jgi:hypothetical protein
MTQTAPPEDANWRYELKPDDFALLPGGTSGARSLSFAESDTTRRYSRWLLFTNCL